MLSATAWISLALVVNLLPLSLVAAPVGSQGSDISPRNWPSNDKSWKPWKNYKASDSDESFKYSGKPNEQHNKPNKPNSKPYTPSKPYNATTSQSSSKQHEAGSLDVNLATRADNPNLVEVDMQALGITGFNAQTLGENTNAIASWFHTNKQSDSTNGDSWCYNRYDDSMPGFAPSVSTMLSNFDWSNEKAGRAYCGLEAEFTTETGKKARLILMDGFSDQWVRTPSSIDVIYNAYAKLHGSTTDDKNAVEKHVSWHFTGYRDQRYIFNTLN